MATQLANELLNKQLDAVKRRRAPKTGVDISKSTGIQYNVKLQKIVQEINRDINKFIVPLLRKLQPEYETDALGSMLLRKMMKDSWVDEITAALNLLTAKWESPQFDAISAVIATEFVVSGERANKKSFNKNMKSFGIDIFGDNPSLLEYTQASIYDNTQLIQSIPQQYLTNVESIIMANVRAGNRSSAITKQLSEQFGITQRRAKMIARDQTSKLNGDLNAKRQTSSGFNYFTWLTAKDSRVRDRHRAIAAKTTAYGEGVYRWDFPPIGDQGTPIIPGQAIRCRCTAIPVPDWEVDENRKAGQVSPGVKR